MTQDITDETSAAQMQALTPDEQADMLAGALRLAAVQVLLADPNEIPDDLEESLYSYRDQLAGLDARR